MRNSYFAAILLASLATGSAPVAAQERVAIFGEGSMSCGQWLAAGQAHSVLRYEAEAWVRGLLTGMNAGNPDPAEHFVGDESDPAVNRLWLDNFCRKQPLASLFEAAMVLRYELKYRLLPSGAGKDAGKDWPS
jgi:hypothetical protein